MNNGAITALFGIQYPIVQAGMVWCSGWRLAAAVSNAGGLGLIGAGSMQPDLLREHIQKCKYATALPFGVNVPLLYPQIEQLIEVIEAENVQVIFTSAGNPATWTGRLKKDGRKVIHVVSSAKFARKSEDAGVDGVVAEGFEAGGHNGREETTTLCLVPSVCAAVRVPVIAAGGIASGRAMLAMEALGASGVQVGSRFASSLESSAHLAFKQRVITASEGDTILSMKKLNPVRLIKNEFYEKIRDLENMGGTADDLRALLGRGRSKKGIFEGDLTEGELEIGQISAMISAIQPAAEIVAELWNEYLTIKKTLCS